MSHKIITIFPHSTSPVAKTISQWIRISFYSPNLSETTLGVMAVFPLVETSPCFGRHWFMVC